MESGLKPLLNRFVDEDLLTPEVVTLAGKYLLSNKFNMPFFKNDELFDAVVYLKDIMDINKLHDLGDILEYYEDKKRSLSVFISHSLKEQEQEKLPDQIQPCNGALNFTIKEVCSMIILQGSLQSFCTLGSGYLHDLSPLIKANAIQSFIPESSTYALSIAWWKKMMVRKLNTAMPSCVL